MSRPAAALALGALLVAAACRHATKVGEPEATKPAAAKPGKPTKAQQGVPPRGEVPRIPSSPKALLAEGEIGRMQEALERRGYLGKERRPGELDDPTTTALRKFQRDERLADTGFPDRLTLQKLGLDPEKAYGKVRDESKDAGSAGSGQGKDGGAEKRSAEGAAQPRQ